MKKARFLCAAMTMLLTCTLSASALTHTVVRGDTMWKLAVRYKVGTSEIIAANPQIADPNLIYPGQKLTIPGKAKADTKSKTSTKKAATKSSKNKKRR